MLLIAMFKIKEAAMGSVTRPVTYISVTALTLESGCSTFIKHRFPAVGSFGWVVFGLVLGWVVSAYSDRI